MTERRPARWIVLACLLLALAFGRLGNGQAETVRVRVLHQPAEPAQQAFVTALASALPRITGGRAVLVDGTAATGQAEGALTIALGLNACREAARSPPDTPLICALVPRQAVDSVLRDRAHATALYLDQPVDRVVALTQAALPDARRIGFLYGPSSQPMVEPLRQACARHGLNLAPVEVTAADNLVTVLRRHVGAMDVLLALPDPLVFRSENIYALLLTTYRANVPVIGFSEAYVAAGALTGVYSTAAQLGGETAEIVAVYAAQGRLPPPRYPRAFSVGVNHQVASSLQRTLPSEADLQARLEQRERRPSP